MAHFKRRDSKPLRFRGPNQAKPTDPGHKKPDDAASSVKLRRISKKPAKCGEQNECPLRSKCKAGVCQPDPAC